MPDKKKQVPKFRIRTLPKPMLEVLANIAQNTTGLKQNAFIKIKISEILNSYPDHIKEKKGSKTKRENRADLCVMGISDKTQQALENIAQNTAGLDINEFMLVKLYEVIKSYPQHTWQSPIKD